MSSPADAGESEQKLTEAAVPAAALATLKKMAKGAKITQFAEEIEHGQAFYEGSWKAASGTNIDVLVTLAGDLVEIEEQAAYSNVPETVRAMVNQKAGEGTELAFEKKTMILYEAKFRKGEHRYELLLTPDGRIIENEVKKSGSDEDEDEQQVSIDDVPKAVKAAIIKNSEGGKIEKIERENEDGKVIYEAEVTIDGKEVELKIACCGKLLSKETEDEDEKE